VPNTAALTDSGNAICVTLTDLPFNTTSAWMCVARPWYHPGKIVVNVTSPLPLVT
jgi:hypothetical protein